MSYKYYIILLSVNHSFIIADYNLKKNHNIIIFDYFNVEPCTTGSSTGTRKEKPENYSDSPDYVPIGGPAAPGYPYPYPLPYPYPYQPAYQYPPGGVVFVPGAGNPYRSPYPFEPQYPVEAIPPAHYPPYYAPPPTPYVPVPYQPSAYPGVPSQQPLYDQSTVVDAYRSPLQQSAEQSQFFRQPAAAAPSPYYFNAAPQQQPPQYIRAHAYNRPPLTGTPTFLQQRDASSATGISSSTVASIVEQQQQQYDQQQPGSSFDGNQFNF